MTEAQTKPLSFWRRRNWWKIGFFVALFAFECAREIAVIEGASGAQPNVRFALDRYERYTNATGVWKRTDGGGNMSPAIIQIDCYESRGSCVVADVQMTQRDVFPPNISTVDAQFAPDSINFTVESGCTNLTYRLDFKLNKVNAIREAKPVTNNNDALCNNIQERIDLTLVDSPKSYEVTKGNFLPIFSFVKLLFASNN